MATEVILIMHGWGGNKPTHWQETLYQQLNEAGVKVHYPKMPNPAAPELDAWLSRVEEELAAIQSETPDACITVVTHSLGAVTWMHLASRNGTEGKSLADRVLLVAPPYIVPQIVPIDVSPEVAAFFPPPMSVAGIKASAVETTLVASDTDDYATYDQSCGYARDLGITIHKLPGAGHISPYYGYGEWPWVLDWCLRKADFPPIPRPTEG